jgi:multicopper oxidase
MRPQPVSRRTVLTGLLGLSAGAALAACGSGPQPVGRAAIAAAKATRETTGRTRSYQLRARRAQIDLGGRVVDTWAYGDTLPGAALRATAGDRVRVAFTNDLPQPTSVHWHGLAIRNDMDGVPGLTTPQVAPGGGFGFDFVVPDPDTYWFHPHSGLQLDRGLYTPFIVDDPNESGRYDAEWVLVLDDWTDGVGSSPEQILARLQREAGSSGGMGGMGGKSHGSPGRMGGDSGDVTYPLYLVNGRVSSDPDVLRARPGDRVRLRLINAGADTVFQVALGSHDLRITHSDGFPVEPVSTPLLRIGMGERYDAVVTLSDGVFPLVAEPVGKSGLARALVRTGAGAVPAPTLLADNPGRWHDPLPQRLSRRGGHDDAARLPHLTADSVGSWMAVPAQLVRCLRTWLRSAVGDRNMEGYSPYQRCTPVLSMSTKLCPGNPACMPFPRVP